MGAPTKPLQLDGTATCARLVNRCNRTDFPSHITDGKTQRKKAFILNGNYYSIYYIVYFFLIFPINGGGVPGFLNFM